MYKSISIGIEILDRLLNGGLRIGYITEFAGYPWSFMKKLLHNILVKLAVNNSLKILYNQYFDGLDTYLLNKYAMLYRIPWSVVKERVRVRRSFKVEDYLSSLRNIKRSELIILVDPFLNMPNSSINYLQLYSHLRRLIKDEITVLIFNKLSQSHAPIGGHLHSHLIHFLLTFRQLNSNFVEVSISKAIDIPSELFYVDISSLLGFGRYSLQHTLLEWV